MAEYRFDESALNGSKIVRFNEEEDLCRAFFETLEQLSNDGSHVIAIGYNASA
jgi:hypothetical protein